MDYIKQEKEEIIQELIKTKKVYSGKLIDYQYLLEIYEQYKNKMSEPDFAETLGIKYSNYCSMKRKRK